MLQYEFPASIVLECSLQQSNIQSFPFFCIGGGKIQQQWALGLQPLTLQRSSVIRPLRPLLIPCRRTFGETERSPFANEVQEKVVASLRQMVAEGNAFIVCADDDIHCIVLAFVISRVSCFPRTLSMLGNAFLIVQRKLVVMIPDAGVFTVVGNPSGIYATALFPGQLKVERPVVILPSWHSKGRLIQPIVDANAQAAFDHYLAFERDCVGQPVCDESITPVR